MVIGRSVRNGFNEVIIGPRYPGVQWQITISKSATHLDESCLAT
jgi:hypothetical protein